jgi:hypothetical protein
MTATNKGGRQPRYTAEQVIAALIKTKGLISYTANVLGCSVRTVSYYIERYPTVKAARDEARDQVGDLAELRLFTAIDRGESWAIQFFMRTQLRHRSYGDLTRQEIDVKLTDKAKPRSLQVNYDEYNRAYAEALTVVHDAAAAADRDGSPDTD